MFRALIVTLALLASSAASAGWSGNGGDMSKDQNNPWFLTTDTDDAVEYCVLRAADYPLDLTSLRTMVRGAVDQWLAFFHDYGIDQHWLGGDPRSWQFRDGRVRRIATRWIEVPLCDRPDDQVQFAFGITTPLVRDYMADVNQHSLGAALRGPYNHTTFRNGGTVWLAHKTSSGEDWILYPEYLKHQLLHEIGHVFGMKHNSVFVMDERVADVLTIGWYTRHFLGTLGHIEEPSWPYRLRTGMELQLHAGHYMPEERSFSGWFYNAKLPDSFETLLGLDPRDVHRITLRAAAIRTGEDALGSEFTLIVEQKDTRRRWEFHGDDFQRTGGQPSGYWLNAERWQPGVYTDWQMTNTGSGTVYTYSYFQTLDLTDDEFRDWPLPMTGSFMIEGRRFAAVIDRADRGMVFRMMDPVSGEWLQVISPAFVMQLGPK